MSQTFGGKPGKTPRIKWSTPFMRRWANVRLLFENRPSAMAFVRIYLAAAISCVTTVLLMEAFLPSIPLSWDWVWIVLATPIVLYAWLLVMLLAPDGHEIKQRGIVHLLCVGSPTTTHWEDLVGFRVEEEKEANVATMILYHKKGRREQMALPQGESMVPVFVEVGKHIPLLDTEPPPPSPQPTAAKPMSGSALFIMYVICHVYALGVGYLMIPYIQWRLAAMTGILLLGPGTVGAVLLRPRQLFNPKEAGKTGLYVAVVILNMIGSLMTLVFAAIMWIGMTG